MDADSPLMEAGVDSLGAVELRNQLQLVNKSGMSLPSTLIFDHPTARQLALMLTPALSPTAVRSRASADELLWTRAEVSVDGMSVILPRAMSSPLAAERMAACSHNAISEVPTARWELGDGSLLPEPVTCRVRHGGFVWGIELADHVTFSISRAEAAAMDPCQRCCC